MTNEKIIETAKAMMEDETDDLMLQELWRIQLYTENQPSQVSYCDGGEDDGKRFPYIANSNDHAMGCSNCKLSNSHGKYGCVRNTLALGHD